MGYPTGRGDAIAKQLPKEKGYSLKNLEKTKKNRERLAEALRENLKKRKSRSRFLAENQHSAQTPDADNSIHSKSQPEGTDISAD